LPKSNKEVPKMKDKLFKAFCRLRMAGLSLEDVAWFLSSQETIICFEDMFQKFFNPIKGEK